MNCAFCTSNSASISNPAATFGSDSCAATSASILELKQKLSDLTILGHHYQQQSVIDHCDFVGDSLELSRQIPQISSKYIVFCGVYFMAESAALLARPGQTVYQPDLTADCVMARMTPADLLDTVLQRLCAQGRKLIPLAYVNTSLAVKSVVGKFGGAVCTSSNASKMLDWALRQGDGVLFLPDKNLGRNTARQLGLSGRDSLELNIQQQGQAFDLEAADRATLLFWPGLCAIHAKFKPSQIADARAKNPECQVIVHPECAPEVVKLADAAGSTSFIINYAKEAKPGTTIYIGTEINLVKRLAARHPQLNIQPLHLASCSHMAKTTPQKLATCLQEVLNGQAKAITAPENLAKTARQALETMLEVCR